MACPAGDVGAVRLGLTGRTQALRRASRFRAASRLATVPGSRRQRSGGPPSPRAIRMSASRPDTRRCPRTRDLMTNVESIQRIDGRRCCAAVPASDRALPATAPQRRGRAGAARRDSRQQRCLRPRLGLPAARPFRRGDPSPHLRSHGKARPRRQDRDADHAEDLPRRPRPRRHHGAAISRPACRRKPPPSSTRPTTAA